MSDTDEYMRTRPVARDASGYVRNCLEPTLLGMHPAWVVLVFIAIFISALPVRILCLLVFVFIAYSAQQQSTLFDTARRMRRKIVGAIRKPFRSY